MALPKRWGGCRCSAKTAPACFSLRPRWCRLQWPPFFLQGRAARQARGAARAFCAAGLRRRTDIPVPASALPPLPVGFEFGLRKRKKVNSFLMLLYTKHRQKAKPAKRIFHSFRLANGGQSGYNESVCSAIWRFLACGGCAPCARPCPAGNFCVQQRKGTIHEVHLCT